MNDVYEELDTAKRNFDGAHRVLEMAWNLRDIVIECGGTPDDIKEWDQACKNAEGWRDRAYDKLQVAYQMVDADQCQCLPIDGMACRACRAQSRLEHGDEIPWE